MDTLQCNILWNAADKLFQAGRIEEAEEKLRRALPLASDKQIPQITQALENCRQRKLLGEPGQKPALGILNGIGTTLYGRRDYDAGTNTYVATQWLVFLFLPLFPAGGLSGEGCRTKVLPDLWPRSGFVLCEEIQVGSRHRSVGADAPSVFLEQFPHSIICG